MGQSAQDHPDIHDPNAFVFYRYHPSLAAAVIFLAGFLLTTGFHILQAARKRTYYFIPLIIGGACRLLNNSHGSHTLKFYS